MSWRVTGLLSAGLFAINTSTGSTDVGTIAFPGADLSAMAFDSSGPWVFDRTITAIPGHPATAAILPLSNKHWWKWPRSRMAFLTELCLLEPGRK